VSNKSDTSIDQLINIVTKAGGNNQILNNLIKTLHKTIPVVPKKRRTPMIDSNLNKTFRLKRINHSVIATITESDSENMYTAKILSIEGKTLFNVGDNFPISKHELKLTGQPTSSKS